MTIAMCSVTAEGIVMGADSTSSVFFDSTGFHYFNHNQKLFEIGENSTLGMVTWGLGQIGNVSYRTLVAKLDDELVQNPAKTVSEVAQRFSDLVWQEYSTFFVNELAELIALSALNPFDPALPPDPAMRTSDNEQRFHLLRHNLTVGFCIGGHLLPERESSAYEILVLPTLTKAPAPRLLSATSFWGAPNFILRLLNGWDHDVKAAIMASGKWQGTEAELVTVLNQNALHAGTSTLRDAIDFVYSSIHSTIKALKFSSLNQVCGGPIELAVISTDRRFRWVRHKKWDSAITDGDII